MAHFEADQKKIQQNPWLEIFRLGHDYHGPKNPKTPTNTDQRFQVVVQNAEKTAVDLKASQIGTDALLLSLLTVPEEESPNAQATRAAAFPGMEAKRQKSLICFESLSNQGQVQKFRTKISRFHLY